MISAKEANKKYFEIKAEQEKMFKEAKVNSELSLSQSTFTMEDVEARIQDNIGEGICELLGELNKDIVSQLKNLGYAVYLCKKICEYIGWTNRSTRAIETYSTYITTIVWNSTCFNKNFYDEIKEY